MAGGEDGVINNDAATPEAMFMKSDYADQATFGAPMTFNNR